MDKGAIRPEFSIQGFIKDKEADKQGVSVEEQILATGSNKPFWLALKKHIEKSIEQLEQINEEAMAAGMPLEEIGRNTLVISQTKGVIRKIFNVVEDAKASVEEANKDGQE